jgi:hypothetical protein
VIGAPRGKSLNEDVCRSAATATMIDREVNSQPIHELINMGYDNEEDTYADTVIESRSSGGVAELASVPVEYVNDSDSYICPETQVDVECGPGSRFITAEVFS